MGTNKTLQHKFVITERILQQIAEKKKDIDYEGCIALIMRECYCERRKARELFAALIPKFPYRQLDKWTWEYIEQPNENNVGLTSEEEEILQQ